MKQLFLNIAENTHSALVMRNLYFIIVKKYLGSLISNIFYQEGGFTNVLINTKCNSYEDCIWEVTFKKAKPVVSSSQK